MTLLVLYFPDHPHFLANRSMFDFVETKVKNQIIIENCNQYHLNAKDGCDYLPKISEYANSREWTDFGLTWPRLRTKRKGKFTKAALPFR